VLTSAVGRFFFAVLIPFPRSCHCVWLLFFAAFSLGGCASKSTPLADTLAAVFAENFGTQDDSKLLGKPNPNYRYLRVEVHGRAAAFLVLGYVDAHPQGNIEVWYSAKQEVIKIQNGRIVGTAGLEVDWRAVNFPSPAPLWATTVTQDGTYLRQRDEMPSHRYAIADQLILRPWQGMPPIKFAASLTTEQARTYTWFQESTVSSTAEALPPAWYALGMHRGAPTVVYSMQCLSTSFCLTLQRWPVQEGVL
jgi:hypothetical protein